MRKTSILVLSLAAVAVLALIIRKGGSETARRVAELEHTCEELREQVQARDQTIAELQAQFALERPAAQKEPGQLSTATTEAELQRRLTEVAALQAKATELVEALAATREAPEAVEIPEQLERARASINVYEKHLQEARQKASALSTQLKDSLISMNIPRDVAAMEPNRGLASVDLQAYWPYFEMKREFESQNMIVERLRMRMLQETVEAEVLEAQKKAAK